MTAKRRTITSLIAVPPDSGSTSTQDAYALCSDDTMWVLEDVPLGTNDWVQVDTTTVLTSKDEYR